MFRSLHSAVDVFRNAGDDHDDSPASTLGLQMAPRSLNSDISYFGVGGKQAIFFIGTSTRVGLLFSHLM